MGIWYRIQEDTYPASDLLEPDNQTSMSWGGNDIRDGVSVCESIEALADYLAQSGIPFGAGTWNLITLEGELSGVEGMDAELGESLVYPTRIVSVEPIDVIVDEINAAFDRMYA